MAASSTSSSSPSYDEAAMLAAEIAKLEGRIDDHHHHQQQNQLQHQRRQQYAYGYGSNYAYGGGSSYGYTSSSSRGGYAPVARGMRGGRGRGRGAWVHGGGGAGAGAGPSSSTTSWQGNGAAMGSRHRTLVMNNTTQQKKENGQGAAVAADDSQPHGNGNPGAAAAATAGTNGNTTTAADGGWVKKRSTHNMSLVSASTYEKSEAARLRALQSQPTSAAAGLPSSSKPSSKPVKPKGKKSSASVRRGDNMGEVIVDGVVFAFDETGTKLVKKDPQPSKDEQGEPAGQPSTSSSGDGATIAGSTSASAPLRTSVNGQSFIRTKRGNLISLEAFERRKEQKVNAAKIKRLAEMGRGIGEREKARKGASKNKTLSKGDAKKEGVLCSYYTKTGQCRRGLSCPYVHSSTQLAICPGALRPSGCNQPPGLCPLSHTLDPRRVPHCVHFLSTRGQCRNGEDCKWTHPPVELIDTLNSSNEATGSDTATASNLCIPFMTLGWCAKGEKCKSRHTFDCADFILKGSCERKGCRLQHVVRGAPLAGSASDPSETVGHSASFGVDRDDDGEEVKGDGEERGGGGKLISSVPSHRHSRSGKAKRRRHRSSSSSSSYISNGDGGEEKGGAADGDLSFVKPPSKKRNARPGAVGFGQQKDFIGFDDDDEEEEEEGEGGEGESEGEEEEEVESISSGSSGTARSSEGESDDDDDDDEETEEEEEEEEEEE